MKPFDWEMEPGTFEDMVSCLLANLNTEALRIDGAGGDGGRDVQFPTPAGQHIYELKSFTGRMNVNRRAQVKKSLKNAGTHSPCAWDLVVPINPTPNELTWFEGLKKGYKFPLRWLGKTWLDAQMVERPSVWRYYREDANAEVVEILKELGHEGAALEHGMPDVIERAKTLVSRANELGPHYTFKVETDGKHAKVNVFPRYVGAMEDRPITARSQFRFDTNTPEGKAKFEEFKSSYEFGTPAEFGSGFLSTAEVDAPAGLGGVLRPVSVTIGPGHAPGARPVDFEFVAVDPDGNELATLEVTLAPETVGKKGLILAGRDRSGLFYARLAFVPEELHATVDLGVESKPFFPNEFLPAVRLTSALHAPNRLLIRALDADLTAAPVEMVSPGLILDSDYAQFVADVALIQGSTGVIRLLPAEFSGADFVNASAGASLIRGGVANQRWTSLTLDLSSSPAGKERIKLAQEPLFFSRDVDHPARVVICGFEYLIGRKIHIEATGQVVEECAALLVDSDAEILQLVLRPVADTFVTTKVLES